MTPKTKAEQKTPEIYEEVMQEEPVAAPVASPYLEDQLKMDEGNIIFEVGSDGSGADLAVYQEGRGSVQIFLLPSEVWELADTLRKHVDNIRRERTRRKLDVP